ncbi:MAG TPA: thiamine phosphate synthase [Bryobacteraceae bacterium]|nr:thiamine phosphate synthase [Bryobacteraceae bacterium]
MRRLGEGCLYLVTDRRLAGARPLPEIVAAAVRGGVSAVQLREKECGTREFVELARELNALLAPAGIPLLINDRVDVALAAGAGGIHLGQSDLDPAAARRLLGDQAILGLSVETMEQARQAASLPVDYLGVSPIFPTPTKTDVATNWGLEGLANLRRASRDELIAIGGIHAGNAGDVIAAGADGLAVVSALVAAADPAAAARELVRAIGEGLRRRVQYST